MSALRIAIGLLWLVSFVAGRGLWPSAAASPIVATSAEITVSPSNPGKEVARTPSVEGDDHADPRFDLFGNEIEDALADYRFDLGGDVYERHSPETEVQKLGSPRT